MSLYPVYREIANLLQDEPFRANDISLEQLRPIVELSLQAPNVLLDTHTLKVVQGIINQRAGGDDEPKPKPKPKPTPNPKKKIVINVKPKALAGDIKAKPKPIAKGKAALGTIKIKQVVRSTDVPLSDLIDTLNTNHKLADNMSQKELEDLLLWSDTQYYDPVTETDASVLDDKVYDYIKRIYNQRRLGTNDKKKTMASISSVTGVGKKPVKGRDSKLPIAMYSLDNLFKGEGNVASWSSKMPGPYFVSTKMDGTSGLYHDGHMYTKGDATHGRDISHVIPFLGVPEVDYTVRGEIVIRKDIFDTKYKDKQSGSTNTLRKVNRNSVSGAIGSITHIDQEFLSDLEFLAYEIILPGTQQQMSPSKQFDMLEKDGFTVAYHKNMPVINDESLSALYHEVLDTYSYEIDGLVIIQDQPYTRASNKNPEYAKAFKEALTCDTAISEIIKIEWNISQYGYIIPTAVYKPVEICGVTLSRATAHHAKDVIKLGLGPGAQVEIIYWGKVNPRINRVLKAVEPQMPDVAYKWVPSPSGENVHIMFDKDTQEDESSVTEALQDIEVKKIHKFLVTIDAKGIGEATVKKIYETGITTIGDFVNMTADQIRFLGPKTADNAIESIQKALHRITVPVLMASSKVFGRGLGVRKFTAVFRTHPEFICERLTKAQYITAFCKVEGFATKTATLAAEGMDAFWEFIDNQIPEEVYQIVIENTLTHFQEQETLETSSDKHADIDGHNICVTGFRNPAIQDFITKNGGKIQSACNGSTHLLIRKNDSYTNSKTDIAASKGIPMMSAAEFTEKYMS